MELREFISKMLTDVIGGIQDAQAVEGVGGFVVPSGVGVEGAFPPDRGVLHKARLITTVVQFDIAVTAETERTRGGRAGLQIIKIVEAGIQGQRSARSTEVSRIQFAIPLILPQSPREWFKETSVGTPGLSRGREAR